MAGVAKWLRHWIVVPVCVGSNPITRPIPLLYVKVKMNTYKTHALILRTYDFKDFDKIVVLYSKDRGLIRAIAKGIKRPKSKLGGRLEPLMASNLILSEGRNLDIVSQCEAIDYFKGLRTDLKKITFGMYFGELASAFGLENDPTSESFYEFLFNSLKNLENAQDDKLLKHLLVKFQYDLISIAGYAPMLDCCNNCRKDHFVSDKLYFFNKSGALICYECSKKFSGLVEVDQKFYKYLKSLEAEEVLLDDVDQELIIKTYNIMLDYIKQRTNIKLKTPALIETLCLG